MKLQTTFTSKASAITAIALLFTPVFIMILYEVIYLHSILDNKPVSKSLEKYYTTMAMSTVVLLGLGLLSLLAQNIPFKDKIYPLVINGGVLALYLYNYLIINKGEHPDRGAIITNLVLIYPALIGIGLFLLVTLLGILFLK